MLFYSFQNEDVYIETLGIHVAYRSDHETALPAISTSPAFALNQ